MWPASCLSLCLKPLSLSQASLSVSSLVPLTLSQALAASRVACLVCPRILSLSHSVSLSLYDSVNVYVVTRLTSDVTPRTAVPCRHLHPQSTVSTHGHTQICRYTRRPFRPSTSPALASTCSTLSRALSLLLWLSLLTIWSRSAPPPHPTSSSSFY
jgi:hypothetical protein